MMCFLNFAFKVFLVCEQDVIYFIYLQVRTLLQEYGIVCVNQDSKDARRLVFEHEILYNNRVSDVSDHLHQLFFLQGMCFFA